MGERKLLVVDDNSDMCSLVTDIAEDIGYTVTATTDASEFQRLYDDTYDVVMLDLVMPGVDGIELLRFLDEQKCNAAIIIMSGVDRRVLHTASELAKAHGLRMAGALTKPFRVNELIDLLNEPSTGEFPPVKTEGKSETSAPVVTPEKLEQAILNGHLVMHYQPQVNLVDHSLYGAEALVRWLDPEQGMIFPDQFIGLAEETGLIRPLTDRVIQMAVQQAARWRKQGMDLSVSVNIPVMVLSDLALPNQVESLLAQLNLPPDRLMLEVTETGLVRELKESLDVLTRLRMKGIALAVDDFGTGYSSLEQVGKIPATELKIDKSFVFKMTENSSSRAIVNGVIEMGRHLGMRVIAEGIETEDILKALVDSGCRYGQGYLISRPLPPETFEDWCRTSDWSVN